MGYKHLFFSPKFLGNWCFQAAAEDSVGAVSPRCPHPPCTPWAFPAAWNSSWILLLFLRAWRMCCAHPLGLWSFQVRYFQSSALTHLPCLGFLLWGALLLGKEQNPLGKSKHRMVPLGLGHFFISLRKTNSISWRMVGLFRELLPNLIFRAIPVLHIYFVGKITIRNLMG